MPMETEIRVKEAITALTSLSFEIRGLSLGTKERVDGWIKLNDEVWLILELEDQQKHSPTNILKLWRFLENKTEITIVLMHVFFNDSKVMESSRGTLGFWLAQKIEKLLPHRFYYRRLTIDRTYSNWTGEAELIEVIAHLSV